jgi:hypothetical protein
MSTGLRRESRLSASAVAQWLTLLVLMADFLAGGEHRVTRTIPGNNSGVGLGAP